MARGKKDSTSAFKAENLIYLVYADNNAYTNLRKKRPKGLKINLVKGTWTISPEFRPGHSPMDGHFNRKIGEARAILQGNHHGVIGVYDRTKFKHIVSLSRDSGEALKDYSNAD